MRSLAGCTVARRWRGPPIYTVLLHSRLARTWCNYSLQFRVPLSVTVTLRLCPPNARCISARSLCTPLHLVSSPARCARGSQVRFDACALLFLFFLLFISFFFTFRYPVIRSQNVSPKLIAQRRLFFFIKLIDCYFIISYSSFHFELETYIFTN